MQTGTEQDTPDQLVVLHAQVLGAVHMPPLEHAGEHTGVVQLTSDQPASHEQIGGATHVPCALHIAEQKGKEPSSHDPPLP